MAEQAHAEVTTDGSSEPEPCFRIGRYQLVEEIAAGGQATLYLAVGRTPGGFGKAVALKHLHPHLVNEPGFREMFLDEARIASRLNHPNVCGVFDYGQDGDAAYLVMEYLIGESLAHIQSAIGRCPDLDRADLLPAFARIIADAARGLHAAHELRGADGELIQLVHRDVSPLNIFVTFDGTARMVDFGIARTNIQSRHTETGVVKGKFAYMAPEQLTGTIDRRADVWGLGVTLWELLTGRRLFKRSNEFLSAQAVLDGEIPDPADAEGVDSELAQIAMRALERDIDARFSTAEQLADALERWLARHHPSMSPAGVADLMNRIFPGQARAKEAKVARALEAPAPDEDTFIPLGSPTGTGVRAHIAPPAKARPGMARRLALAAVGVLLAGGLGLWTLRGGEAAEAPAAGADDAVQATVASPPEALQVAPALPPEQVAPERTQAQVSAAEREREAPATAVEPDERPSARSRRPSPPTPRSRRASPPTPQSAPGERNRVADTEPPESPSAGRPSSIFEQLELDPEPAPTSRRRPDAVIFSDLELESD